MNDFLVQMIVICKEEARRLNLTQPILKLIQNLSQLDGNEGPDFIVANND